MNSGQAGLPSAAAAPPAAGSGGHASVSLTTADVKKLMDAAVRMQRAGQTSHPKYAQIVALLRQYHQRSRGAQQPQSQPMATPTAVQGMYLCLVGTREAFSGGF